MIIAHPTGHVFDCRPFLLTTREFFVNKYGEERFMDLKEFFMWMMFDRDCLVGFYIKTLMVCVRLCVDELFYTINKHGLIDTTSGSDYDNG